MACESCPDAVTFTLRDVVQTELDNIRSIKNLSTAISRALQDVAQLAVDTVERAIDLIPVLPGLDFSEIIGYLTCPLTPLALAVDFDQFASALDPTVQLQRLKALGRSVLNNARREFEAFLDASDYRQVIGIARKFANEFLRIRFNPASFAKAVVISATVLAVCGREEYEAGPYLEFANELTNFSLTGPIPSGLDVNVSALLQRLIEAETRFKTAALALT